MKKYFKFILILSFCLIFITGCLKDIVIPDNESSQNNNTNEENSSGGEKGILKIYLTDAPGDYLAVNINLSRIEGHIAVDGEEEEGAAPWQVLMEWPDGYPVDLIKLEDFSLLLGSLELTPNKYTQLRLFLKEEASLIIEGEEGEEVIEPLEIPSSLQTGIKLNHPFEIIEGNITEITIDFDAQKSIIQTGNGKHKMKPVISLSSETYSSDEVSEVVE